MAMIRIILFVFLFCTCHSQGFLLQSNQLSCTSSSSSSSYPRHVELYETVETNDETSTFSFKAPIPEIDRRRNLAIISHPDSGKTTMTEKLLLYGEFCFFFKFKLF